MMRLRTKITLVMTSLVLFVVAVLSYIFAAQLLDQLISETDRRAGDLAQQVFLQAKHALVEAAPDSDAPNVRHAFEINEGLRTQLAAARSNPLIYEVSITDTDGMVLASTDEDKQRTFLPRRASLSQLVRRSFLHQMNVLMPTRRTANNPQLFEHCYAIISNGKPFGEVRVIVDSALLVQEIRSDLRIGAVFVLVALVVSTLLAVMVSELIGLPGPVQNVSVGGRA